MWAKLGLSVLNRRLVIWLEIFLKLVGNKMDLVWKFVGSFSNSSLYKSSWNNWLVLKRTDSSPEKTDRCQLLPPGLLVDTSQTLPPVKLIPSYN